MVFEVGKGGIENGLEEAILQLHLGDQAVIILPSHLAFGLLGDQKKIPQRATVIYEIDFIKLSKKTIK
jgi:FKBP-type peptidyl-prolyl cis-trans isomerase